MTPEEREAVLSLVATPGGDVPVDPAVVLARLGAADGTVLGARLLRDAVSRHDPVDAEMALIVTDVFGVSMEHLQTLIALAEGDWHFKHEDVVTLLGRLRSPESVSALRDAARWVPDYLDYDESRALAVKAVRALASIPGDAAEEALVSLLDSDSETVRRQVAKQLERRRGS